LSQIFTNFIMNSIIHGFADKEEGTIDIEVSIEDNKNCHIIYRDNGKGLDKKTQKNICNPFYTTKMGKGGSGLGMNIVENIITKQLQGTLNIDSKEGEYTKFEVSFPI
jgi:signal transduction histidine kinase